MFFFVSHDYHLVRSFAILLNRSIHSSVLAYVKGGERERFNPLSGAKYERLETHDANNQDDAASTSTNKFSTREGYQPKRGRPNFFKKEERLKWKGKGRLNSPYRKNVTESTVKTVEVNKTKEKS